MVITVGYDIDNLKKNAAGAKFSGEIQTDMYGRKIPKSAHGTVNTWRVYIIYTGHHGCGDRIV